MNLVPWEPQLKMPPKTDSPSAATPVGGWKEENILERYLGLGRKHGTVERAEPTELHLTLKPSSATMQLRGPGQLVS